MLGPELSIMGRPNRLHQEWSSSLRVASAAEIWTKTVIWRSDLILNVCEGYLSLK